MLEFGNIKSLLWDLGFFFVCFWFCFSILYCSSMAFLPVKIFQMPIRTKLKFWFLIEHLSIHEFIAHATRWKQNSMSFLDKHHPFICLDFGWHGFRLSVPILFWIQFGDFYLGGNSIFFFWLSVPILYTNLKGLIVGSLHNHYHFLSYITPGSC